MNKKITKELYDALIKIDGIDFRGVSIGDFIKSVIEKEGKTFEDRKGSLPNYKYFFELGEMEELIIVYSYSKDSKKIYNIELTLKTYPKYYWKKNGGTDEVDFYQQTIKNTLKNYVNHFTACKDKVLKHFEDQLGIAEIDNKHYIYNKPHQNFSKHTWVTEYSRLVLMSYLDDEEYPRGSTTMELVLILTAV